MATIVHHGKNSTASWTSGTVVVSEATVTWTIEVTTDAIDISSSDETTTMARTAGHSTWTATVTVIDSDVLYTEALIFAAIGENETLTIVSTDGVESATYTGAAILMNMSKSLEVTGLVQHTFNFQGAGALTVA